MFAKQQSMFKQHAKTTKNFFRKDNFYANLIEIKVGTNFVFFNSILK